MKKFLISVLALIMGVTLAFGLVACGDGETPDEGGNGEVTMTDAEIAEQAMSLLKSLYSATTDNDSHYDVLGQVKVGESSYKVDWTVSSETENIENYVSIGQMDETSKLVRISLTMGDEAVEFKLKATVTVGEASASAEFAHKLNAKPADAKGTADDPFSTRKAIEIANGLQGTPPVYYYSEADQGAATPTLVWVEGYLVEWGNETTFTGGGRVNFVYIVENYTDESTRDSADALCIASIDYNDVLTCIDDLAEGKHIVVRGYIELYQGGTTTTPKPELAYYKEANGTYHNVYCEELEKEQRTPQQNVELALGKVEDTLIFNQTGDLDLPASTIQGVTFTWSTTDPTYTIANNKLHIGALPATDATVTATITATYGTETVTNNTKNVTITIKAAVTAEEGTAVFDFSGVSEKGVALSDGDATDYFKSFANADSNLTKAEVSKIYKGNGQGGAHAESAGFLKAGTASAAGQIKLTFSKNVTSVVVNCHDWFAKSANYPTNSNTVAVNGSTQPMPYNETGTPGDLTFTLSEETNVVTIDINTRGFIFKITVTFGEGTVEPGPEPGPGGDTETKVFTPITSPVAGQYYMGMKTQDGNYHYITGAMNGYYMATTTDVASAKQVTLAGSEADGWTLVCDSQYIEIALSNDHINAVYNATQTAGKTWKWDSQYNIFVWEDDSVKYFLGTYGTYVTVGGESYSEHVTDADGWKAVLGTFEAPADMTDQDKVNAALASLTLSATSFNAVGDTTLPTENSYGAQVIWTATDHSELVTVEGTTLKVTALPNETTTVTLHVVVTLNSAKAEKDVTITVEPADTTNYGTEEAPLSVAEALALAEEQCVESNDVTNAIVYVKGIVLATPTYNSKGYYNQFTIRDENEISKTIIIYTITVDSPLVPPAQNDVVVLYGYIKNYNGTIEFASNDNIYVHLASNTRGESNIATTVDGGATLNGLPDGNKAVNGTEVTFTVTVEAGKQLVSVKAYDKVLTATDGTTYKFTMNGDVTIEVEVIGAEEKAAVEVAALTFTNEESTADGFTNSYTSTYTATRGTRSWELFGFNNGQDSSSNWGHVRTGRKSGNAVTATITTKAAMPEKIEKVVVTVDQVDAANVNSFTLESAADASFTDAATVTLTIKQGENTFEIAEPAANLFYRITIDCAAGSANGFVRISKVSYWGQPAEGGDVEPEPEPSAYTWKLVESVDSLSAGAEIVFVYDTYVNGGLDGNKYLAAISGVTLSADKKAIASLPEDAAPLTLGKEGENWTFSLNGQTIGLTGTKNGSMAVTGSITTTWTITIGEGGVAQIASTLASDTDTCRLQCNTTESQQRFTNYKTSTQNDPYIYIRVAAE